VMRDVPDHGENDDRRAVGCDGEPRRREEAHG
jgi:hypothetical protein